MDQDVFIKRSSASCQPKIDHKLVCDHPVATGDSEVLYSAKPQNTKVFFQRNKYLRTYLQIMQYFRDAYMEANAQLAQYKFD
jgi:hypothetical protein